MHFISAFWSCHVALYPPFDVSPQVRVHTHRRNCFVFVCYGPSNITFLNLPITFLPQRIGSFCFILFFGCWDQGSVFPTEFRLLPSFFSNDALAFLVSKLVAPCARLLHMSNHDPNSVLSRSKTLGRRSLRFALDVERRPLH